MISPLLALPFPTKASSSVNEALELGSGRELFNLCCTKLFNDFWSFNSPFEVHLFPHRSCRSPSSFVPPSPGVECAIIVYSLSREWLFWASKGALFTHRYAVLDNLHSLFLALFFFHDSVHENKHSSGRIFFHFFHLILVSQRQSELHFLLNQPFLASEGSFARFSRLLHRV